MDIYYSPRFSKLYKRLPEKMQTITENKELIFRSNPFDPRLKTHKLTGVLSDCWAFSVDYKYRIIFEFRDNTDVEFLAIGTHDIYQN